MKVPLNPSQQMFVMFTIWHYCQVQY